MPCAEGQCELHGLMACVKEKEAEIERLRAQAKTVYQAWYYGTPPEVDAAVMAMHRDDQQLESKE